MLRRCGQHGPGIGTEDGLRCAAVHGQSVPTALRVLVFDRGTWARILLPVSGFVRGLPTATPVLVPADTQLRAPCPLQPCVQGR